MSNVLKIYCDGACSGNPGKGGWGAVLIWGENIKKISGFEQHTTNNRMELMAAISGLMAVKKNVKIEVYTDSQYVANGITTWILKWRINNWRSKGKDIKNVDLWQQLDHITSELEVTWHWVKGHSGDFYNEMADQLARDAIALMSN